MTTPRPTLTVKQKLTIMARYCRCPGVRELKIECGAHLPTMAETEFDHIGQRAITGDDTIDNYRPLCPACHDVKSNGRGGTRRISSYGSDAHARKKARHLSADEEAYRRRLLAKDAGEPRPRSKWPKRKFTTRKKPRPAERISP